MRASMIRRTPVDDAARRLERELNIFGQHLRACPRSRGLHLDRSAYLVLHLIDWAGPSTLKEIATSLELDQSTVNRQVNRAVDRGLLDVIHCESGPNQIVATTEGRAAFIEDRATKLRDVTAGLAAMTAEDRTALISGMTALNAALGALDEDHG